MRQARRATELMSFYQQRSLELARLRRDAIQRATVENGLSFTEVALALGLSKGRITQIRQSAPPSERAFFGVGPVTVAVPERTMPGRSFPVVSAEDTATSETVTGLLTELNFQVRPARVPATGDWSLPTGDLVAVCGPLSSPVMARVYATDPLLDFAADEHGRYWLTDRVTGERWGSAMDDEPRVREDVAYLGRVRRPHGGTMIALAGVHAIGSLGAAVWLRDHLEEVHEATSGLPFSMVVRSTHDGLTVTATAVACPPRTY